MSNQVSIIRTKFEDYTGISYGWRILDNFDEAMCLTLTKPTSSDNFKLIKQMLLENDDATEDMLGAAARNGVFIDGEWLDATSAKKLIEKAWEWKNKRA